jgi:hypothetical protein
VAGERRTGAAPARFDHHIDASLQWARLLDSGAFRAWTSGLVCIGTPWVNCLRLKAIQAFCHVDPRNHAQVADFEGKVLIFF